MTAIKKPKMTYDGLAKKYSLADFHEGKNDIFADIVEAAEEHMHARARGILSNPDGVPSAKDVVQEALIQLWRHRKDLKNLDALPGYINTLTVHTTLNSINSAKRRFRTKASDDSGIAIQDTASLEQQIEDKDTINRVIAFAENEMPKGYGAVFLMTHAEGMTSDEIAQAKGIGASTVRSQRVRAERWFKERFDLDG